jgi:hypothetical protein
MKLYYRVAYEKKHHPCDNEEIEYRDGGYSQMSKGKRKDRGMHWGLRKTVTSLILSTSIPLIHPKSS